MQAVKRELKRMHKQQFGKAHDKVTLLRKQLDDVHCQYDFDLAEVAQMRGVFRRIEALF